MTLPVKIPGIMLATSAFLLACTPIQAQSSPFNTSLFAAPPPPPDVGTSGQRRSEAGSRQGCRQGEQALTALVPVYGSEDAEIVWATSAMGQPAFWFYVPYAAPNASAELVLEDAAKQQTVHPIALATRPGVLRVNFPETARPLAAGKHYRWYFNIYCSDRNELYDFVEGTVTRKPLGAEFDRRFIQDNLPQKLTLFAQNGIWHEALTVAGALRCVKPNDPGWTGLLQAIGLGDLAKEAIVNCDP